MMETMITSLTPTRAEVNDVANSVMDGADAVMLSGETAAGNYPVQVIQKMTQIIEAVENSPLIQVPQNTPQIKNKAFYPLKQFVVMRVMANAIEAKAISTMTTVDILLFNYLLGDHNSSYFSIYIKQRILTQLSLFRC
jgi:pyruvate kinase